MTPFRFAALAGLSLVLSSCGAVSSDRPLEPTVMAWDHVPQSSEWEVAGFSALQGHAAVLTDIVPADVTEWCPGYPNATEEERAAFWLGLLSALARHESTWNEQAARGVAADWGPLHPSQSSKREEMRAWVSQQSYCQG